MFSEIYRQSPEFRAELMRQAEHVRLAQSMRPGRWFFNIFARAA